MTLNTDTKPLNDVAACLELIRFRRPIGWILLVLPALWVVVISTHQLPPLLAIQLILGAFFMRSSGCIINDIWDRNLDRMVARTKNRPLPAHRATVKFALAILACFLGCSALVAYSLPTKIWYVVPFALALSALYPLVKRVSYFPQVILGITFSLAVPMAVFASHYPFDRIGAMVMVLTVLWVVLYDSQYAVSDLEDDINAGIKSLATLWRHALHKLFLSLEALLILGWILLFTMLPLSLIGSITIITTMLLFFLYQNLLLSTRYPALAMRAFYSHGVFGTILLIELLLFLP